MWTSWPAAASTTPAARPASTTACTPSTWAKTPRSAMWSATTARAPAPASASRTPRPSCIWRRGATINLEEHPDPRRGLHQAGDENRGGEGRRGHHHREAAHPRGADRRERYGDHSGRRGGQRPGGVPLGGPGPVPAGVLPQGERATPGASAMRSATPSSWATPRISSIPAIVANHVDAQLIHEAAIGRIAGDQILKLMTLGLTEQEAEEKILDGFLQ